MSIAQLGARLVHRHAAWPKRRSRRGRRAPRRAPARARCPVSSTVWCAPGLEVALARARRGRARRGAPGVEHVVEEADARSRALARARAVEVERRAEIVGLARWCGAISAVRLMRGAPSTRRGRESPRRGPARRRRREAGRPPRRARIPEPSGAGRWPATSAGLEARRAAGGQHVVRAGHVVAEGGAGVAADEQAARRAHAAGQRLGLRRPRARGARARAASASAHGGARARGLRPAPARASATLGRSGASALDRRPRPRRAARASGEMQPRAGCPSPCSAWASRSSATAPGRRPRVATTTSSLGPATPSMPTSPATWRFASCT